MKTNISIRLRASKDLERMLYDWYNFTHEVVLEIHKDKVKVIALDTATVALMHAEIRGSSFKTNSTKALKKPVTFGINTKRLYDSVKGARDGFVSIRIQSDDVTSVISVKSVINGYARTYRYSCLDTFNERKKPELSMEERFTVKAGVLRSVINDAHRVAESIKFVSEKEGVTILCEGDDTLSAEFNLLDLEGLKGGYSSRYSIEYLRRFLSSSGMSANRDLGFSFKTDHPCLLTVIDTEDFYLDFILAPRVEND